MTEIENKFTDEHMGKTAQENKTNTILETKSILLFSEPL